MASSIWRVGTSCKPEKAVRKKTAVCVYCKRGLFYDGKQSPRSFTRDHLTPLSKGGRRGEWVACCHRCNQLKSDIDLDDWLFFIARYPKWWMGINFRNTQDVRRALARIAAANTG